MLPLLPFAAGLLAGAAAVKLLRNEKTHDRLEKVQEKTRLGLGIAQDRLRDATIESLSVVESASAAMKQRLSADKTVTKEAASPAQPASLPTSRKAPRKKAAPARKPAAPETDKTSSAES